MVKLYCLKYFGYLREIVNKTRKSYYKFEKNLCSVKLILLGSVISLVGIEFS
jgi:hypothetical protein